MVVYGQVSMSLHTYNANCLFRNIRIQCICREVRVVEVDFAWFFGSAVFESKSWQRIRLFKMYISRAFVLCVRSVYVILLDQWLGIQRRPDLFTVFLTGTNRKLWYYMTAHVLSNMNIKLLINREYKGTSKPDIRYRVFGLNG